MKCGRRWALTDAVLFAALLTPFVATWVMPTWLSVLVYPVAVAGLYLAVVALGQRFLPAPPEGYYSGLPGAMKFLAGVAGVATGLVGRAIGLVFLRRIKSGVAIYCLQLVPMLLLIFVLHLR